MMMKRMFGRRACPLLGDTGEPLVIALPLLLCAHTNDVDSNSAIPRRAQILGSCFTTFLLFVQTAEVVQLLRTCVSPGAWSWPGCVVAARRSKLPTISVEPARVPRLLRDNPVTGDYSTGIRRIKWSSGSKLTVRSASRLRYSEDARLKSTRDSAAVVADGPSSDAYLDEGKH